MENCQFGLCVNKFTFLSRYQTKSLCFKFTLMITEAWIKDTPIKKNIIHFCQCCFPIGMVTAKVLNKLHYN